MGAALYILNPPRFLLFEYLRAITLCGYVRDKNGQYGICITEGITSRERERVRPQEDYAARPGWYEVRMAY